MKILDSQILGQNYVIFHIFERSNLKKPSFLWPSFYIFEMPSFGSGINESNHYKDPPR